ncbi:kinesin-8, putative [Babesia caballi]|uniref:Kinesin-like protein n=1 Tax=Babesia caballi TaxID=5871 RepID=A0AAV4M0M9_BABCB|nr:kinesin-8, putative [Babesia caballi]
MQSPTPHSDAATSADGQSNGNTPTRKPYLAGRLALRLASSQGRLSGGSSSPESGKRTPVKRDATTILGGMKLGVVPVTPERAAKGQRSGKSGNSPSSSTLDGALMLRDLAVKVRRLQRAGNASDGREASGSDDDGNACPAIVTPTRAMSDAFCTPTMLATTKSGTLENRTHCGGEMESRLPSPSSSIAIDETPFRDCMSEKSTEWFAPAASAQRKMEAESDDGRSVDGIVERYYSHGPERDAGVESPPSGRWAADGGALTPVREPANENIKVVIRLRPVDERVIPAIRLVDNLVEVHKPGNARSVLDSQKPKVLRYEFDSAFDGTASQEELYEATAKALVPRVFEGANGTVFAYGCTSAGKTYTMIGDDKTSGVVQMSLGALFELRGERYPEAQVRLSFMEVYNECVFDLLAPGSRPLEVQEENGEVRVPHLTSTLVDDRQGALALLARGVKARKMATTDANRHSSRSHAVIQVTVEVEHLHARLSFVDLAGSERAGASEARTERLKESSYINQSLLALANCISSLAESATGRARVKYRDSKLTLLLKNALFNNARVVMVVAIHPGAQFLHETSHSLKYAQRAKDVKVALEAAADRVGTVDYAAALREAYAAIEIIGQALPEAERRAVEESLRSSRLSGKGVILGLLNARQRRPGSGQS